MKFLIKFGKTLLKTMGTILIIFLGSFLISLILNILEFVLGLPLFIIGTGIIVFIIIFLVWYWED